MTLYWRLILKKTSLAKESVFWGLLFVLFWVYMWIYKFIPENFRYGYEQYQIGTALAYLYLLSIAALGTSLTSTVLYGSIGLKYATCYSKLRTPRAIGEIILAGSLALAIYYLAIYASILVLAYERFESIAGPKYPLLFALSSFLTIIVTFELSFVSAYLAALSKKFRSFILVAMFIIAFSAYFTIRIDYGSYSYVHPILDAEYLIMYSYSGDVIRAGIGTGNMILGDVYKAVYGLLFRIFTLPIIAYLEIKLAKGVRPEEIL